MSKASFIALFVALGYLGFGVWLTLREKRAGKKPTGLRCACDRCRAGMPEE